MCVSFWLFAALPGQVRPARSRQRRRRRRRRRRPLAQTPLFCPVRQPTERPTGFCLLNRRPARKKAAATATTANHRATNRFSGRRTSNRTTFESLSRCALVAAEFRCFAFSLSRSLFSALIWQAAAADRRVDWPAKAATAARGETDALGLNGSGSNGKRRCHSTTLYCVRSSSFR